MKRYNGPQAGQQFADYVLGGHIKQVDGEWFWAEYHVAYAQSRVDTGTSFVTREEAEKNFEARLTDMRTAWGYRGAKFSEEVVSTLSDKPETRCIRFRSIRKNGKPGTLTGTLYMCRINRPE